MFEIEVTFSLPDVNNDPINKSCVPIVLEVEWNREGDLEYINARSEFIPTITCLWLSDFYEILYRNDDKFKAQIDAAIQQDIKWVKENVIDEPY